MKSFLNFAAILGVVICSFSSCDKEIEQDNPTVVSTHKVTFVANPLETKTNLSIDGDVVTYMWSDTDATDHSTGDTKRPEKFQVFENGIAATSIDAELVDGTMWIEAEFANSTAESFEYQALFNAGVKAEQSSSDESYDQYSDVLISNILTDKDNLVFSFKREIAMAVVTLKGLEKGTYLYNVKIESDKPLAGTYNKDIKAWENTSNILSIDSFNEITDGVAKLYFITIPVEDAMLKVKVETTDDTDNVTATYVKEFTRAISFSRGDVRAFNVNLEGCETLPVVEHSISWTSSSEWASDTDNDTFSLTTQPYGYSVVLKKNNGSTAPTVNATDNDCRLYAKGTATISNAKNITKIVFNISTQGKKRLAPITASVGTIATQALGDETVVWTGKAKEITFTVGDNANYGSDGSNKAGQLDFSSIDVTYLDDGTPDPEPEQPTEHRISIDSEIIGGTVSADKEAAVAGAQITLSYEAAAGYEFGSWNVTSTGGLITVTDGKFTMPEADVNVSATFNKADGTITTISAADGADIKFVTGSSSANAAFWANSSPLTANGISLSGTNGSSSSFSYYDGNVVRFYQNNSFTLTPSAGVTITKVEIVRQSTTSSNSGTINCSGLVASTTNTTTNTNIFTGSATSAVTFTAAAQARFTSILVYSTGEPSAPGVPDIYNITIADDITGGTVSASSSSAEEGTEITLTVTPNTNKKLKTLIVENASTNEPISTTETGEGKYTFHMPAANVNVDAEFVALTEKTMKTAVLSISATVTANGRITDDKGNEWTVSSDGSYIGNTSYIQVGTNNKAVTYLKLSTSEYTDIEKIQVWGTSKANTDVTAKIIVDGTTKIEGDAYTTQNASSGGTETSIEFNPRVTASTGIEIEISRPSSATGAIYFNKAIVTYYE